MRRVSVFALGAGMLLVAGCGGGSIPASSVVPGAAVTASAAPGTSHVVTLPVGSVTSSTLDLESGVTTVVVTAANLPGQLLTAVTPGSSGVQPSLTTDSNGIVHVQLPQAAGGGGPNELVLVLNRAVTWSVFLDGGATTERVNLRDAKINVIGMAAGVSTARVTLPQPTGTDLLRMSGGVSHLAVLVPKAAPTRVHIKGGASAVRIGSATHTGIGSAVTYDAHGYARATNRIDVELEAGVSAVSVEPY